MQLQRRGPNSPSPYHGLALRNFQVIDPITVKEINIARDDPITVKEINIARLCMSRIFLLFIHGVLFPDQGSYFSIA